MDDRDLRALQAQVLSLKEELDDLKRRPAARRGSRIARALLSFKVRLALLAMIGAVPLAAYAATISMPYIFVTGTPADADEVNANFDTLVVESNDQDSRLANLEASVTTLQGQVATHTTDIGTNATNIATNAANVGTNAAGIATDVLDIATNSTSIGTNAVNIAARGGSGRRVEWRSRPCDFFGWPAFASRGVAARRSVRPTHGSGAES